MAKVSEDEELEARIRALDMSDPDAATVQVISIAKELGIELTPEDFVLDQEEIQELSDDELSAVSGGGAVCGCSGAGYGHAWSETTGKCVCIAVGEGYFKNNDEDFAWLIETKANSDGSCVCVGAGAGGL